MSRNGGCDGALLAESTPPMIVPLEVVGGDAGAARLVGDLLQADAAISKRRRTAL